MNKDSTKENSMNEKDLLEFLQHALGCTYISDLQTEKYNKRAKLILEKIDIRNFSLNQIRDAIEYVYYTFNDITDGNS
jgi:hypothetical protein